MNIKGSVAAILYSSRLALPFHTRFYQLWKGGGGLYVLFNVVLIIDKHSSVDIHPVYR